MKSYFVRYTVISAILLLSFLVGSAAAMGGKISKTTDGGASEGKLQESFSWYDGDKRYTVWLNPEIIAEFDPGSETENALKRAYPAAKVISGKQAGVRLWQLPPDSAGAGAGSISKETNNSPVFHDSASASGPRRALPGNIIVYFNPEWDENTVSQWAAARGLNLVKKMNYGTNIYVIATGPGLEALTKANSIYESGEVVAAFPNWWKEVVTK